MPGTHVKEQAHNKPKPAKRGRKPLYDDPTIVEVLTDIWQKTNLPCAKSAKSYFAFVAALL